MTVTDTTTNQYWTGTGNAGPEDLTSYVLSIGVGTPVVTGGSDLNVCVGEQIPLTANYGPSDMTLKWTVAGSIIKGYNAPDQDPTTTAQTATITNITGADLTQPSLTYYWMDTASGKTDSEQVTLAGTLGNGESVSAPPVTFNVYRPTATFTTTYPGSISLVDPAVYDGDDPNGTGDGITFYFSVPGSPFGGIWQQYTAQIVARATVTTKQYNSANGTSTTFEFTEPWSSLPGPLLDTNFPYEDDYVNGAWVEDDVQPVYDTSGNLVALTTFDAPDYSVDPPPHGYGFGPGTWSTTNVTLSEGFGHNLLFLPNLANATYAPLSQVSWGWEFDAENGFGGFSLASSAKVPSSPPTSSNLSTLPTWNNNAANPTWGWPNPDWFAEP